LVLELVPQLWRKHLACCSGGPFTHDQPRIP
jgi:hypothetical protein